MSAPAPSTSRPLTLAQYVRRRTGVPMGARGSLRAMLARAFGAPSFAAFWRYWNPIFGYGLGRWVYGPLRRVVPASAAVLATFVVSGAIHDAVTMLVRGQGAFLFVPWFFLMGLGVLAGEAAGMDLSGRPWPVRALVHVGFVGACLAAVLAARSALG